jgi:arabinogalactan oligomer/maltooligosaccharide transport system permease protein
VDTVKPQTQNSPGVELMKFIDYVQLNPFQKIWYNLKKFFINLPGNIAKIFKAIGRFFKNMFVGIGKGFAGYFSRFVKGDWATKLSYIIMGFGNIVKGQIIKGLLFLATEVLFILYMIGFGWDKVYNLGFFNHGTIGFVEPGQRVINPETGRPMMVAGDDSMKLLLYGVMTLIIIAIFFVVYIANTKSAYKAQQAKAAGEKLPGFIDEFKEFFDSKFHITLLAFPTLTISIFTIMPLIFMILIAFTNYDHQHIGSLFSWVGLETFGKVFSNSGATNMGETFVTLVQWTLIWAVLATVLNYILGMIVALLINKKGIKLKALWRTLFVVTVAVPQFVSLLLMSQMLDVNGGAINVLLHDVLHWTPQYINFLGGEPWVARATVIIVNIWVGIPYTILITSGILMNIPADLYESATIDGAGPARSFFSITLPYMLFVTTPYLITSFVGNINNFNVIYLLTANLQNSNKLYQAGYTDLLVTWLFKLTMNSQDYNYAAAIGILVFIVCATVSLLTFNLTKSAKNEEEFS